MIINFRGNEEEIVKCLSKGDVISIATDTVYGLCANAFDKKAVKKIFTIKNRPLSDTLAVVVKDKNEIYKYTKNLPKRAQFIIDQFLPGALTVICESNGVIKNDLLVKNNNIAFRVVENEVLTNIFERVNFPLALTSANIHGRDNCVTAQQVYKQLGNSVKYIIDGIDRCIYNQESTIVHFEGEDVVIDREGVIDGSSIFAIL